ncbi:hypothetical protein [Chromobacterium haemolyticum]|uniref:hypothetical protein n=1 Tax=Chromobacterium haemolyticum TaxID=394935 RepID=UPI001C3959B4|nr:hypothetical protein [Chromobacterium haemolyticum]
MKIDVLLAVEKVHHCAWDTGQFVEVADCSRVNIDTANASEICLKVADARLSGIESLGGSSCTTANMAVPNFDFLGHMRAYKSEAASVGG